MNKLTFCLFLIFRCAKVIKIIQLNRSLAILFWQKIGGSQKKIIESVFKAKVESTYSSKCALKGRAFFHLQKVESTYNSGADFNLNDKHPSPQPKGKGEGCLQDIVIYCYADV